MSAIAKPAANFRMRGAEKISQIFCPEQIMELSNCLPNSMDINGF
jgi:hypothetical protein